MDLLIKCGAASTILGHLAAYGFTVRRSHRLIHQESGLLQPWDGATEFAAHVAAVTQALFWLASLPFVPGRVLLRTGTPHLAALLATVDSDLSVLRRGGWEIELEQVGPEWVSEAAAPTTLLAGASCIWCPTPQGRLPILGNPPGMYDIQT